MEQTLALMNGGARLDEVIHGVVPPARLMERPYLQPVYDEPEFIVRTVWRLYGGWWDGNPATLKPAPERSLALELAELAGGAAALADRALALMEEGGAPVEPAERTEPSGSPGTWPSWPGWPPRTIAGCRKSGAWCSPGGPTPPRRPWPTGCSRGRHASRQHQPIGPPGHHP